MEKVKFFDNTRFNNFDNGGLDTSVVKGQFTTGCADPYILRYNGMYYLYVTTSGLTNYGLRAWKSRDLLNWEKCQGKGLPVGYVVDDKDENGRYTQNAYAPEVYYFNGKFYMIISPGPAAVSEFRGHRILVADNPEGPFEAYSEQIDRKIDGSLLIDDDEEIYFFHATPFGITVHPFNNMKELGEGALIKASDGTGAWTEGPGIVKVRGYYYLTYTGCHYQTPGYQVIYAVTNKFDKTNINTFADSFVRGASRIVLLNCDKDEGHVGLGHSINFMGPDLDSYYICYHNLDALYEDGMTHRSFNIDRLLIKDGVMTSVQNKTGSILPKRPFFESFGLEKLSKNCGLYLSLEKSKQRFTAEFNSSNGGEVKYLFSYQNEKNYYYIKIDYRNKEILLGEVKDGEDIVLEKGTFKYQYRIENNHTIRVAYDGLLNVYFDNLLKISTHLELKPGYVGYLFKDEDINIGYTAISEEANGSSDKNEYKQALGEVMATLYVDELSKISGGPHSLKGSKSEYYYSNSLLFNKNDYASYLLNFKTTTDYGIQICLEKKYLGKKLFLDIDEKEYLIELPKEFKTEEDVVKVFVPLGNISKGLHTLRIRNVEDKMSIISFLFVPLKNEFKFNGDFKSLNYVTPGYSSVGEELLVEGRRNFASISNQLLTDAVFESDIKLDDVTEEKGSIGIMLRQNNYAYSDVPKQDFKDANTHIQGYYLEIKPNKISLCKYNFGDVKSYSLISKDFDSLLGIYHRYRIENVGNNFKVFMDGDLLFDVCDPLPFAVGACALYSYRSKGSYKNLKIETK